MRFVRNTLPLLAAALLAATAADARPSRVGQVPHGSQFGCALCHVDPAGGGTRNVFGQMIEDGFLTADDFSGEVQWGPELAAMDADGDGATNGEELQDPNGSWTPGQDAPGEAGSVTRPWDADSFPEVSPTAIAAATWAQIKASLGRLAE